MIEQIRTHIQTTLQEVTLQTTPNIYRLIQTTVGYKRVENMIIRMMIGQQMTASGCIIHVENML